MSLRGFALLAPFLALACADRPSPRPDTAEFDASRADAFDEGISSPDGSAPADVPHVALRITAVDPRFVTAEHMLTSFEMQSSGEPLAEAMGRDINGYSRTLEVPDLYRDPGAPGGFVTDLPGYASAVESYEYSKQPMNGLAFETGAGTSFAFGPLLNPGQIPGEPALALVRDAVQRYGIASAAGIDPSGPWVYVPAPEGDPRNTLGWAGLCPTVHPYQSFDPSVDPLGTTNINCAITSDNSLGDEVVSSDYECDYNSLHLRDRAMQLDTRITPRASGFAAWKYLLWVTNYLQSMHDAAGNPVASVRETDLPRVGEMTNGVVGADDTGAPTTPGTYLGSSHIEGFQAALMIAELDNQFWSFLHELGTTDGVTLSGFATLADALSYDYQSAPRWPAAVVRVSETPDPGATFPRPAYSVDDGGSEAMGLLGLLGGAAEMYALTDRGNPDVGGSQPARAYFDGDPFAQDDGLADAEDTAHDRALALIRVALIDLDRFHATPEGMFSDRADPGVSTRGSTVSTLTAAYAVVALRQTRRALGSTLTLYSNTRPDIAITHTPLDALPLSGSPGGQTLTQRLDALLRAHAELLYTRLTDASGSAVPGWDLGANTPTGMTALDAQAAAVRGLLESYLATGQTRFRDRAILAFSQLEARYWDPGARVYLEPDAGQSARFTYTPMRFALVQSALREMYKLVGSRPGNETLGVLLEARIARLDKLVLNGWDDRNDDQRVDWPDECLRVVDGLPRGGLQMAERTLSGEIGEALGSEGEFVPTSDRDHDCVPEVDDAHLPAALAASVTFERGGALP